MTGRSGNQVWSAKSRLVAIKLPGVKTSRARLVITPWGKTLITFENDIVLNPYRAEYSKLAPPLLNINYLTFYIGIFT